MDFSGEGLFLLEEEERREREEDISDMKGGDVGTPLTQISERWVVVETENDGNCFYNTMASALLIAGRRMCPQVDVISKASVRPCARTLRREFAEYVSDLLDRNAPFEGTPLRAYIRDIIGKEPAEYLDDLYTEGEWSTDLDFALFASFTEVCLQVFSPGASAAITGIYGDVTNPIVYVFANGTHFELLLPYNVFIEAYRRVRFDNAPGNAVAGEFIPEAENTRYARYAPMPVAAR
jgi:hypothetical protein